MMKLILKLINALTLSTKNASPQVLVGILISLAMISSASAERTIGESESYIDSAAVPKRAAVTQTTTTLTQTQEQELLTRVNTARINGRQCGSRYYKPVSPVTWNTLLEAAAQRHSNDMANNNWFSHYGSDGSSPWDRIRAAGYSMLSGGENIAAGYSTVLSVIEGWLKSPGHCANIMSPYFREIGAAKAVNLNSYYRTYWTLDLASKR
jgi:uncharacterized protein YkwD